MFLHRILPTLLVITGVGLLTGLAARTPRDFEPPTLPAGEIDSVREAAGQIDAQLQSQWTTQGLTPAGRADELTVLRRLSLALCGTIPSLEEIRRFENDTAPHRLQRWTAAMLGDDRFVDYFAERLARAFVGVEAGQFVIFRRDRFTEWLRQQLREHRGYDEMVSEMITGNGVWTGRGEVNFLTAAFANEQFDRNKLTARTVRAFLGQRIDCAQCHDHPFDAWTQDQFEGLTAHYGQVGLTLTGVHDRPDLEFEVEDQQAEQSRIVDPAVPFHPEWLPEEGSRRQRLAAWVTHPENRRFERAIANRVWGLMFGRPFLVDRAVDDLPSPEQNEYAGQTRVLDLLGADFREHGYDLRRLIRVIAATQAFQLASQANGKESQIAAMEEQWAVFPLVRLRPEQVIGSMLQASFVGTIDQNSHVFIRFLRLVREADFVSEFGDPGEDELSDRAGTIPQALLRMNGELARELSDENPFTAPARIAQFSSSPQQTLENCFLACLTRRPAPAEQKHFVPQLTDNAEQPDGVVEDIYWALYNAPEFSWNH